MSRDVPAQARVLVWDWPVRLFHALLVAAFAAAWASAGDDRWTHLHAFSGYVAALLVAFRLAWGLAGTRHARFAAFASTPAAALAYLRALRTGTAQRWITHNPLGAWAVWFLLALPLVLAATGVAVLGSVEQQGPLAGIAGRVAGARLARLHELLAWAGVLLVAAHAAGVLLEGRIHHEDLVRALVDGRKRGDAADAIPSARGGVALLLLALLLAFALLYFRGLWAGGAGQPYLPYTAPALAQDAGWEAECGSCHLAFHPSLLPARSWRALLAAQGDHFGDDLALDEATTAALLAWALAHEAGQPDPGPGGKAAHGVATTTPPGSVPLRITGTPWWRQQHASIDPARFRSPPVHGQADCAACHRDAAAGTFQDGAMRLP